MVPLNKYQFLNLQDYSESSRLGLFWLIALILNKLKRKDKKKKSDETISAIHGTRCRKIWEV